MIQIDETASLLEGAVADDQALLSRIRDELAELIGATSEPGPAGLLAEAQKKLEAVLDGSAESPKESLLAAKRLVAVAAAAQQEADDTDTASAAAPPPDPVEAEVPASEDASAELILDVEGDRELIQEFADEAEEYLASAENALLVLESTPEDRESIDTVFRAFHTVKGVSAVLGFDPIAEFSHRAESLLSSVRDGRVQFDTDFANLSLQAVDMIRALVQSARSTLDGNSFQVPPGYADLMATFDARGAGTAPKAPADEVRPNRCEVPHEPRASHPGRNRAASSTAVGARP